MARGQPLSPYQKGIVKRYYENRDALTRQKLGEIVSELYLCEGQQRAERLWARAHQALLAAGANKVHAEKLVHDRNLRRLAELVSELF